MLCNDVMMQRLNVLLVTTLIMHQRLEKQGEIKDLNSSSWETQVLCCFMYLDELIYTSHTCNIPVIELSVGPYILYANLLPTCECFIKTNLRVFLNQLKTGI